MDFKKQAKSIQIEIDALQHALLSPRTPRTARIFGGLVVAYALSPIDLIPDFIPVFGYLDDLLLVPLGVYILKRMIPSQVIEECRREAEVKFRGSGFEPENDRQVK